MTETLLAGFPVVVRQAVAWGEMDSYRHVNNVVYFRYFENARLEYFRRLDWFVYERETGIGPILAATQARFRRPVTYPDQIAVAARIVSIGVDRMEMEYRLVSENQQTIATEGTGSIVTYHYAQGRKVSVPAEIRRRVEALEGRPFDEPVLETGPTR